MAHINGEKQGSARYDDNLDKAVVDSYANRILLCPTHHTLVDKDQFTYTVDELKRMKEDHERRTSQTSASVSEFEGNVNVCAKDGDSVTGAKFTRTVRIKSGSSFTVDADNVRNVTGLHIGGD